MTSRLDPGEDPTITAAAAEGSDCASATPSWAADRRQMGGRWAAKSVGRRRNPSERYLASWEPTDTPMPGYGCLFSDDRGKNMEDRPTQAPLSPAVAPFVRIQVPRLGISNRTNSSSVLVACRLPSTTYECRSKGAVSWIRMRKNKTAAAQNITTAQDYCRG